MPRRMDQRVSILDSRHCVAAMITRKADAGDSV